MEAADRMPNDPGELTLRLTTDFRRNGAEAVGALPGLKNKLRALVEIEGDWGRPNHTTLGPGLEYFFTDKITAGVSVPVGLNKNTDSWGIATPLQIVQVSLL
jgi:hypothetical protein